MELSELEWDSAGRIVVVVEDRHTGEVRMVGYADAEAVRRTLATGEAWFWSRSRAKLWKKGETSGHTLCVSEVWADCDRDTLLYMVEPTGPTCHTGAPSCFVQRLDRDGGGEGAAPTLLRLDRNLARRAEATREESYTRSLLDRGIGHIGGKIREEADELARALDDESNDRVVAEAADVLYHLAVGLFARGLDLRQVEVELARRFARSGHEEKASRT